MTLYGTDDNLFIRGDRARYTGKAEFIHGQWAYAVEVLEGHQKGSVLWTYRKPGQMTAILTK